MFHLSKPLEYAKDSPLVKACHAPQLMLHRHMGFSSWSKNRETNKRVQEEWNKRHNSINKISTKS